MVPGRISRGYVMSNNAKLTTYSELAEVLDQLPALVRAERRRRGVGRSQVAREIGVSSTLVARFEAGQGVALYNALLLLRWLDGAS